MLDESSCKTKQKTELSPMTGSWNVEYCMNVMLKCICMVAR